jgi:hypothetical protein
MRKSHGCSENQAIQEALTTEAGRWAFARRSVLIRSALASSAGPTCNVWTTLSTAPLQGHDAWQPAFDQDAHPECFVPENDFGCVPTARP